MLDQWFSLWRSEPSQESPNHMKGIFSVQFEMENVHCGCSVCCILGVVTKKVENSCARQPNKPCGSYLLKICSLVHWCTGVVEIFVS